MIRLVPMTEDELQAYLPVTIANYANDHAKAGNLSADTALDYAQNEFANLLPHGVATPQQHLFTIEDAETGANVGMIWFTEKRTLNPPSAYICDFVIKPQFRRQGYGKQALVALEAKIKECGLSVIRLHVFGHNVGAIRLYETLGYNVSDLIMAKMLED